MNVGNHETNQNPWWKRRIFKGVVPVWAALSALILGAVVAVALIIVPAPVNPTVDVGNVALDWEVNTSQDPAGPGTQTGMYATDTNGDGELDTTASLPTGLTCSATAESDGSLTVSMTGNWLPGEACHFKSNLSFSDGFHLVNNSTLLMDTFAWDFGSSDFGFPGSGAAVEVQAYSPGTDGDNFTVVDLPTSLAAGESQIYSPTLRVAEATPADGASYTGSISVEGQVER